MVQCRWEDKEEIPSAYTRQIHFSGSGALKYVPTQNVQLATLVQVLPGKAHDASDFCGPNLISKFKHLSVQLLEAC